jgi:cysteinyl-tRNA synthetase
VSLRVHNTLTRQKEPFTPSRPGEVGMYVCGVTPYDVSHLGHARSAIVFDVVARYLRYRGHRVTVVKNYTDVDDKIIARAAQLGVTTEALTERYIAAYERDMRALGVLPPDVAPRATAHIAPAAGKPFRMISLIERLLAAGAAYVVDGDVYFEVRRFPAYGRLSGKNLDELLAGARVGVDERKRDPRDFALWKAAKPGEPSWPGPWGPGRPGWHIECSAMAMEYLGETLDIHGGGADLVFPHHECEIAQSEAATGKPFVRYWIHNGFVNLGAEKMSKSLGNVLTIEALLARHDPEALRLYLLQTHYRNPVEFTDDGVAGMGRPLARFRQLVEEARTASPGAPPGPAGAFRAVVAAHRERFEAAMDDDFNTPQAIGALNRLAAALGEERERVRTGAQPAADLVAGAGVLVELGRVLGLALDAPPVRPGRDLGAEERARIDGLVAERDAARRRRDWARADALRAELAALGITLEDTPAGTTWKARTAPTAG